MPAMPRNDQRIFTEPVTVTCPYPGCGIERQATRAKRNDHAWPGHYCDGPRAGERHPLRQMLGPEGKGWA